MLTRTLVLCSAGLLVAACGGSDSASAPEPTAADTGIRVSSPVFTDGAPIPTAYTCKGTGLSPELHWSGVPAGAGALALVVDDPDAPHGTYTHWVVVDIAPDTSGVAAGQVPSGGAQLRGSGGRGWTPPCPPSGTHHYRFHVYALKAPLGLAGDASLEEALKAIASATVSWGLLTGTVAAQSSGGGGY